MSPFLSRPILSTLAALALGTVVSAPAVAGPDINVSVDIRPPGVWGRIEIGPQLPLPPVVLHRPVIIRPGPVAVERRPIYLYVPPAHQREWGRYCGRYQACGQPVYFVRDDWVRNRWEHRADRRDDRWDHRDDRWDHRADRHDRRDERWEHRGDRHGDRHDRRESRRDGWHGERRDEGRGGRGH